MAEPIAEFEAYVPQIQSATKIGSEGLARIQLDVPPGVNGEGLAEVLKFVAFAREKVLRIVVYETTP